MKTFLFVLVATLSMLFVPPSYAQENIVDFAWATQNWAGGQVVPSTVTETYSYDEATDTLTTNYVFPQGTTFSPLIPSFSVANDFGFPITLPASLSSVGDTEYGPVNGISGDTYTITQTGLKKYALGKPLLGSGTVPTTITDELNREVDSLVQYGHLSPAGFYAKSPGQQTNPREYTGILWESTSEQLYLLSLFAPLYTGTNLTQYENHITSEKNLYPPETNATLPLKDGTRRRYFPNSDANLDMTATPSNTPTIWSIYGIWKYYDLMGTAPSQQEWAAIKNVFVSEVSNLDWGINYWPIGKQPDFNAVAGANKAFAGSVGFINLARLMNDTPAENLGWGMLGKMAALRYYMGKYTQYESQYGYFPDPVTDVGYNATDPAWWAKQHLQELFNYAGNWAWMAELVTSDWSQPIDNVRQMHRLDELGIDTWEWYQNVFRYDLNADPAKSQLVIDPFQKDPNQLDPIIYNVPVNGVARGASDPQYRVVQYVSRSHYEPYEYLTAYYLPFLYLTPELGEFMHDYLEPESQKYIERVEFNNPTWYMSFDESVVGMERGLNSPMNPYSIFLAKAWITRDDPNNIVTADNLALYADTSYVPKVGDYYYMHKLAETIKAYKGWTWSIGGASSGLPGDVDGDGDVDITDLATLLSTFGGSNPAADFNSSGTVDIADLATLLSNFGT